MREHVRGEVEELHERKGRGGGEWRSYVKRKIEVV